METHDRDQLDDLLDGALKQYGSVEPRAGLEGRVLARLTAEERATRREQWRWASPVAGFACLLAVVVWIGTEGKKEPPPHVRTQIAKIVAEQNQAKPTGIRQQPGKASSPGTHAVRKSSPRVANAAPRLAKFPSPRPLGEQERLLVAYVSDFPEQAAESAQEQAKQEKDLEAMYPALKPDFDSNQER